MNVLIIKNISSEGPGTIETFLKRHNLGYEVVELHAGQAPSGGPARYSHLVIMGGPMAVYEMERFAFLKEEARLIETFIKKGARLLGVCLGAQMVAHVLGARVYKGPVQETGWFRVRLTQEGLKDPAMACLEIEGTKEAEVFQWHGDTFDLPRGAIRLATSETYPNQAFRYAGGVYALQFHIEVTPEMLRDWFSDAPEAMARDILQRAEAIYDEYLRRAEGFYEKFFLTNL